MKQFSEEHLMKLRIARQGRTPMKGKKHSLATKMKMSKDRLDEGNGNWKGGRDISYIHRYIRRHLPEPKLCQICNEKPPVDLANISGKYLRVLTDWKYLCRKCHNKFDCISDKVFVKGRGMSFKMGKIKQDPKTGRWIAVNLKNE